MTLEALEIDVLAGIDGIVSELDRLLGFPTSRGRMPGQPPLDLEAQVRPVRQKLHDHILALLRDDGERTAGDLRLMVALLHVGPCIGRMAEECAMLARLIPTDGQRPFVDAETTARIEQMGDLARSQAVGAKRAFRLRDLTLLERLLRRDSEIKRASHLVFERAMADGRRRPIRKPVTVTLIASRCLEEIADDAFEIAEQAAFVVSGPPHETPYASVS